MSVNAISSPAFEPYPRTRPDAAGRTRFYVPASPLRNDPAERGAGPADTRDATTARDPAADAVEFTRDFPGLLVPATYQPPERTATLPANTRPGERGATDNAGDEDSQPGVAAEAEAETEGADGSAGTAEGADAEANASAGEATGPDGQPLADGEQQQLTELKNRDQEVRTHEQAHKAAGGQYAGAISYDYQQGPDGRRYAVGGEVSIDASPEEDPAATIAKMRQVRAAAMAPAEPSPQDRSVAAQAMQQENAARAEERAEAAEGGGGAASADPAAAGNEAAPANPAGSGESTPNPGGESAGGAAPAEAAARPAAARALPPARLSIPRGGYGYGVAAFAGGGFYNTGGGGVDVFA